MKPGKSLKPSLKNHKYDVSSSTPKKAKSGVTIRTAVIGLGRIAYLLEKDPYRYHPCTHLGSLRHLIETGPVRKSQACFELVGACDNKPERLKDFLRWWKKPVEYQETDYRKLIQNCRADFVIIAATLEAHYEIVISLLKSKNPPRGILLEKPAGYNLKETRQMAELARRKQVPVWVNFERRYHPAYRLVRDYIRKEKFGELRSIYGQVLTGSAPAPPYGGPLLHDAVHWIDLLIWMLGKPDSLDARLLPSRFSPEVEDTAFINFHYPEQEVFLESGGRRQYFAFNMKLDFERGRIESGNEGHRFFKSGPSKRYKNFKELQPVGVSSGKKQAENPWLELYREINALLSGYREHDAAGYRKVTGAITAPLDDALLGMEIIQKIYKKL